MPEPLQTLNYAQPQSHSAPRMWIAAILAMTGLGLIALGGCFLIGVLILMDPPLAFGPQTNNPPVWSWGMYVFAGVLSVLSIACFVSAAWILALAVSRMLRIMAAQT